MGHLTTIIHGEKMKQNMAIPSFLNSTHISFLKNWQFQLLEFSHVVH
jgi:hypothetical protein